MQVSLEITQERYDALLATVDVLNVNIEASNAANIDTPNFVPGELLTPESCLSTHIDGILDLYIFQLAERKEATFITNIKELTPDKRAAVEVILTDKTPEDTIETPP